ncbi:hypothetical protein N7530_012267 [Penicillium desertorum]|uniref:Uncharacterized protein n=1 Tax=Penicillium desertorum TaxID=1303715 RepID=A0A9W9WF13_9EURO|nr:hypothetical protein N7530_012267 [Penicillium desertorum]
MERGTEAISMEPNPQYPYDHSSQAWELFWQKPAEMVSWILSPATETTRARQRLLMAMRNNALPKDIAVGIFWHLYEQQHRVCQFIQGDAAKQERVYGNNEELVNASLLSSCKQSVPCILMWTVTGIRFYECT